jgi:hypothetical protein
MSVQPTGIEYRLDGLVFQNGETLNFAKSTRLLYNADEHVILIEMSREEKMRIFRIFELYNDPAGKILELRWIFYAMLVALPPPERDRVLPFKHHLRKGSGVALGKSGSNLFFFEDTGRTMFSKNYTLRDVSGGKIDSDFKVWQFHGYKHEH